MTGPSMWCEHCGRREATSADAEVVEQGEDGGLCWRRWGTDCSHDGWIFRRERMRGTAPDDGDEVDTELGRGIVGGRSFGNGMTDGMEGQAIAGGKPYPENWRAGWVPVCTEDDVLP